MHTYLLTASLMLLKLLLQPWMTVYRMMKSNSGLRSPEDIRPSPLNPRPDPAQLEPNDYVDRSRRLNLNDLESIPAFLIAGLLFVLMQPSLLLAQILMWTYVVARVLHFFAYVSAQLHDVRATFWTFSSLPVLSMSGYVLYNTLLL